MATKKEAKKKTIKAWWFCGADKVLPHGDGRKVREGAVHKHEGALVMCLSGLHASRRLIDALGYAPVPVVCRVECGGTIIEGDDKLVCTSRKYLHVVNIERELHEFAIWCAEGVLTRAKVTDERSWNALKVKRLWLDGKATDAELAAARSAALGAAWSAARSAARSAAWSAAWSAAGSAAWSAALDAARDAAWSAARDAQNRKLTSIVNAKIKKSIDANRVPS